jgi:hypothetical protein
MPIVKTQGGKVITKDGKISCECCGPPEVCITTAFQLEGIVGITCAATPYGTRTINRPLGVPPAPEPIPVRIRGVVDDELIVNGVITQPGQFPFTSSCNGAHNVTVDFTMTAASFVIAAGDNYGVRVGYNLNICFGGEPFPPP